MGRDLSELIQRREDARDAARRIEFGEMNDTVLIAGAGLSKVAGLPTTGELTKRFLNIQGTRATLAPFQRVITDILQDYWTTVFGFAGGEPPSFEDHFTMLDLAANTGHHLGSHFSPKKLRAIRRLSIHRVFDILDQTYDPIPELQAFLQLLSDGKNNALVTTNWDIVLEKHLWPRRYNYSIEMHEPKGRRISSAGISLLKLHGSSNWAYCDCCGKLFAYGLEDGKGALHQHVFIDRDDFFALDSEEADTHAPREIAKCRQCDVKLSSRVATFSYTKTINFVHFLAIWDNAFKALRRASHWIFVGYSFPEADFQLRHMLKAAQLGRPRGSKLRVTVVTHGNSDGTLERFQRFFGTGLTEQSSAGFLEWVVPTIEAGTPA
jgi:NAD-dependent SIR2 family protein deacetylase